MSVGNDSMVIVRVGDYQDNLLCIDHDLDQGSVGVTICSQEQGDDLFAFVTMCPDEARANAYALLHAAEQAEAAL